MKFKLYRSPGFKNSILATLRLSIGLVLAVTTFATATFAGQCDVCHKVVQKSDECSACRARNYCGVACQKADWAQHKSRCLSLRPYVALVGGVKIKKSTIPNGGLGLFARRTFLKGESIAAYSGTFFEERPDQYHLLSNPYTTESPEPDQYLMGQSNPIPKAHLGAQFANDPYMDIESFQSLLSLDCKAIDVVTVKDVVKKYLASTYYNLGRSNVDLSPSTSLFPVFIAHQKIEKGSEIFMPYGLGYWLGFPINICQRKGFPVASVQIQMTASEAVEESSREFGIKTNVLYPDYSSRQNFLADIEVLLSPSHELTLRLAGLLFSTRFFQITVRNADAFLEMAEDLDVAGRLYSISERPNGEFVPPADGVSYHPLSRQLWVDMIRWEEKKGIPTFRLHGKANTEIEKKELLRILGEEVAE